MITRNFKLFLNAGKQIPLMINVSQYDHGEKWVFTLYDDQGQKYTPSTGAIVGIKADNKGIINTGTVNSAGQVEIMETQQMTAAAGKAVFELVIDDGTHGTANFVVLVEPKPGDNADLSETDISMIEQAIEAASTIKPYGSPLVASTVAGMTDHEKVYVYVGSETGYTSGNWYYWDGSAWTSGGVYNSVAVQTDTTLTLSGVAADAKKVGDEINDLKSQISTLSAIPHDVKLAMDTLFHKMAIINTESESYESEYTTIHNWATAVNLVSISAVYTQSRSVFETDSLESLKEDLVVTAIYDNGTSEEITNYFLSGELTEGTSLITVTYSGKTTTFNVIVTAWTVAWDYTDGGLPATVAPNDWLVVEEHSNVSFEQGKGLKYYSDIYGYNIRPKDYQYTTEGVVEVVMNFESLTHHSVRATLGTANDCIIGFVSTSGVKVNASNATPIPNTVPLANTDYTLRVERDTTSGKVYLNDELVYSGELRALAQDNNMLIGEDTHTVNVYSTIYIKAIRYYYES